jgi:beta-phosphoglucomutase family hydrolase
MGREQAATTTRSGLGLHNTIVACLFDLDGVLTKTAVVHAKAWKEMFDAFLEKRAGEGGTRFKPFDAVSDYDRYVDGKPRADGVRSFLTSRRIELPEGGDGDPPGRDTVHGLGSRKDHLFLELIHRDGVVPYAGSVRYLQAVREAGLRTAVVSSSKNCTEVMRAAMLDGLVDSQVDGNVAEAEHLKGKPEPDTYLRAARMLGAKATETAVYEDAIAGVEAGRSGGFGLVVGVDRVGQAMALRRHGADIVVRDLAELLRARL